MGAPFFSVVIPVYNGIPYLEEAVQSVLDQTFSDWELFIVDDQSTDATPSLVQAIQSRHPQAPIRYLRMPVKNGISPGRVRNFGIKHARGEWVAFLDHDDRWLPEKLARHRQAIGTDGAFDLVHNDEFLFDDKGWLNDHRGRLVSRADIPPEKLSGDCLEILLRGNPFGMSCISIRRSALESLEGFDENIIGNEDYDLLLRLAAGHRFFHYIPEPLNCYRLHGGNLHSRRILMIENTIKVFRKFREQNAGKIRALGEKLGPRMHFLYLQLAAEHASIGNLGRARLTYFQSLRFHPLSLSTWVLLMDPKSGKH